MDDWIRWRLVLSPLTVKLWRFLEAVRDDSPTLGIDDLTRDLHTSKTALRGALTELEGFGFIVVTPE